MALINCTECGNSHSDTATACPSCGFEPKKPSLMKRLGKWFLYFIAFVFVIQLIAVATGSKTAMPVKDGTKDKKPTMSQMVASCEVNWEMAFKDKMKDPSSLDWDRKNAEFGMYKDKPVIAVPYRAKNGFGGLTLDKALCEVDPETREVKAALK